MTHTQAYRFALIVTVAISLLFTALPAHGATPSAEKLTLNATCPASARGPVATSYDRATEQQFIRIAKTGLEAPGRSAPRLIWSNAQVTPGDATHAIVLVFEDVRDKNAHTASFYRIVTDLKDESVLLVQEFEITKLTGGSLSVRVFGDDALSFQGTVDSSGNVVADPNAPIESVLMPQGSNPSCEWLVGFLCGTGGNVYCYTTCIALGFVTFWAGLGCAVVCGLIASMGCYGAVQAICYN